MHCCAECAIGAMGDTSAGECDAPVTIVYPSTIDALRARVDPDMRATNAAVDRCDGLPELERAAWRGFYGGWRIWADAPTGLFGLGAKWDAGCAFSRELSAWKDRLRARCEVAGPSHVERPKEMDLSALKWIAGAVIAVAGVYAISKVWPS